MLKLSFLLIGARAFRTRWYVLCGAGAVLIAFAIFLAFHAPSDLVVLTGRAVGVVFLFMALGNLWLFTSNRRSVRGLVALAQGLCLLAAGLVAIRWPGGMEHLLATLFCVVFLADGLGRILVGLLLRLPDMRWRMVYGGVQLGFALIFLSGWPVPLERSMALCVGLIFGFRGWLLLRIGLLLRRLPDEATLLHLPMFASRGWYDRSPDLARQGGPETTPSPMIVHVWTPAGSADVPHRRLLIDRYVAAMTADGVISTGHASLEMPPSLYISHYPAVEIDRSGADFVGALRSTPDNDVRGHFQPSYAEEVAGWCEADGRVEFHNYNPRQLELFWASYSQDDTYNLTNRNCSVVVAQALDSALEGVLATRNPWPRLLMLLANPDVWVGALIRARANVGTWTPGLVLDYARTLARLAEHGAFARVGSGAPVAGSLGAAGDPKRGSLPR
ncbi:HdeD family acid-resistance protein [Ancylobacter terrae]|uniref:HdeD family acid-resistance protein n=1 Tax=Ancylobacter sp. sgz301288 TaxID=3342077 RepID=UPI00385A6F8D